MTEHTQTMDRLGPRVGPVGSAGFVLLCAEDVAALPSVYVFRDGSELFGRDPPPGAVVLPQAAVSRIHAQVGYDGKDWFVADLDSRNGVFVDGKKISRSILDDGCEVRIGNALFKFVANDAEEYARYRADGSAPLLPPLARQSGIVGGFRMHRVVGELERIAPTSLNVLVQGGSGTGKELIALFVHAASGRGGKLCALNCAAIPSNLVESELFGVRKGAFTGADRDRPGIIRAAHEGTLFLDEVGDMPLDAQAKLLRVLETRTVVPVGGDRGERVDVRVVCATHRDLARRVDEGSFRGDLYARIKGYACELPLLRDRKEDIYSLVMHLLEKHSRPQARPTFAFLHALCRYDWPYNIRELDSTIRRALALATSDALEPEHLPEEIVQAVNESGPPPVPIAARSATDGPGGQSTDASAPPSIEELREALARNGGNLSAVARDFGKDRTQVRRWMRALHLSLADFRR